MSREISEWDESFTPQVRYRYKVDGTWHECGVIWADGSIGMHNDEFAASRFLETITNVVEIRYNPARPDEAAIYGPKLGSVLVIAIAIFFLLFMAAMSYVNPLAVR